MTNTITSQLDAEIAKAKKQAADRIAKLKREAAAKQKKIDTKVIELLREQQPALYEGLARQAVDALASAKANSSKSVRPVAQADVSGSTSIDDSRRTFEEVA